MLALPLFAQEQSAEGFDSIAEPAGAPRTIEDAVHRIRRAPRPAVIEVDGREDAFVIPIAGNAAGGNGTYFRSDVSIANYRSISQRIAVGWLAAGQDNRAAGLAYFNLPANTTVVQENFVGNSLGKSGLGAILVMAVDAAGNLDTAALLDGTSRIWTPQPGSAGSVSQTFDGVTATDSIGSLTASVIGLRQSADFRANAGIVNLDDVTHTWTIQSLHNGALTFITVPPLSVVQAPVTSGSGSGAGHLAFTMKSDGFGFWWTAYGTSVDNRTGDGWVARAKQ